VRAEATVADQNKTLVPVTIEACRRPVMFELTQTADLSHWQGDAHDPAWRSFLADVRRFVEVGAAPMPSVVPAAPCQAMPALTLPEKPSIAVLPFTDMTGAEHQDYFVDGMADEITTALTRFVSLFVIANSSTLSYRGEARNLGQIARELGVRYLLEGSVRKSGHRVRITVKLTDAIEHAPLWSERFDGTLEDVFALQDTVANAVAAQIEPTIEAAEMRRASAKPTQNLGAYELYLRALHAYHRFEKEAFAEALGLLDKAIDLDPNYASAMALAGAIHTGSVIQGWSTDLEESRRLGLAFARRALRTGENDPIVLARVAVALCFLGGDPATAEKLSQRALAMCPGSSEIWWLSGTVKSLFPDQAAVGLTQVENALRLDPRSPTRHLVLSSMGTLLNKLQRYDEAIPLLREALQLRPEFLAVGMVLVFSLASAGRSSEAKTLASTLDPDVIEHILNLTPDPDYRELLRSTLAKVMDTDG
jgi:adenylate cyclase